METIARRRLLKAIGALAVLSSVSRSKADTRTNAMMPIIDTHQHLWDVERFQMGWMSDDSPLRKTYWTEDYRRATEGLPIKKSIYMEVDVDENQQLREVQTLVSLCRTGSTSTCAAVVSGRPSSADFANYLAVVASNPEVKGIRQVLHGPATPAGYCLNPDFIRGIRLLGEKGLRFDLCMRAEELNDAATLIAACPETQFVLDHLGNPKILDPTSLPAWKRNLEKIASLPNVMVKVSGIVASANRNAWSSEMLAPYINFGLDAFGQDRAMFGSDWPVCTLVASFKEWVEALQAVVAERPAQEQRKLFHDNAERFYELKG